MKPYTISQEKKSGAWYCHKRGFPYVPVLGSIGDKAKAQKVCRLMNEGKRNVES